MSTPVTRMRLPSSSPMGLDCQVVGTRYGPCWRRSPVASLDGADTTVSRRADRHPGGTGPAGSALAARLASVGFEVDHRLAVEVPGHGGRRPACSSSGPTASCPSSAGDNAGAAEADLVVIATPWDGATADGGLGRRPARGQGRHLAWPTPSPASATSSSRSCRPAARWRRRVQAARARVPSWPPPSTTCRPRSWATSTTRSRATC